MSDNKPIMGYISFGPLDPNAKPITTKANEKVQNAILRWQDLVPEARENVYALLTPEKCASEFISDSARSRALALLQAFAEIP